MLYIYISLFIILILFIPIKLRITIIYQDKLIYVYLFNKDLKIKEKIAKKKTNVRNAKKAQRQLDKLLPKSIKSTLINLSKNPFKPKLKLKYELDYGFEDAALTAIAYGAIGGLNGVIYQIFDTVCKISAYEFNIHPHYNNPMFNFRINSIFSFNLAKIIYMVKIIYFF